MNHRALNFVLFQLLWPCCIFGVQYRQMWPAIAVAIALAVVTLRPSTRKDNDLTYLCLCLGAGFLIDSLLAGGGWIDYFYDFGIDAVAPWWIVLLWAGFALTLNHSLLWLMLKPLIGWPLLLIGAPLSYLAAARIGAIDVREPWLALPLISLAWGALYAVLRVIHRNHPAPAHGH